MLSESSPIDAEWEECAGAKVLQNSGNKLVEAMMKGKKIDTTAAKISGAHASSGQPGKPAVRARDPTFFGGTV